MTLKHTSIGLGLHSLTGQKLPFNILARLGHSISCDEISEIETVQAELVEWSKDMDLTLPLQPVAQGNRVSYFDFLQQR